VSRYWLATERLGLRRFTPEDRDWLCAFYDDEDVTRFLGGRLTPEGVDALMRERIFDYYDSHPGLGMWVTVERESGAPIGFHLLNTIRGETIIQVGFGLDKSAWGKGYATEMARALLRYGFVDLGLPRICAMASLGNLASQRVLTKIGLRRNGERAFPHPAYAREGPMAWFEGERDNWASGH
jgi:RimJ/RimL family protein N-acetyltransferase